MLEPPGGRPLLRVLAQASLLLAVAPSVPGAWRPGARPLSESVLRRLSRPSVARSMTTLLPSRSRVVAIPIDGGRRSSVSTPTQAAGPVLVAAPWGEPRVPFAGVTVSTCEVPRHWLRPEPRVADIIPMPGSRPVLAAAVPPVTRHATISQLPRQPRHWPATVVSEPQRPHGRLRRAATLALGLLVSLVAVEAAARSTRR